MSDLAVRSVVGVALIALAAAALWAGGIAFWLLIVVAGLLMMAEWVALQGGTLRDRKIAQFTLSVPLAIMAPIAAGPDFFALGLVAGAAFFVAAVTRRGVMGAGVLYVGVPVLALLLLRAQPNGILLAFWAMALVWATDIGAFFAGRLIGGPKLAPVLSPNKTWAGLIGGVTAATLLAFAAHVWAGLPFYLAAATPLLALMAQAGDLYESWLKRCAGVKDSGNLLPGHGGLLDRLDGLVAVAPLAAVLVELPRWTG
ncbi:phosphatidate cytidylyltransferase [Sphingomonas sp.]|uniref:phosphatidate cytidylyltransferase n=1 Tax=Sphingomonas sp. TaxID=28214 RepID=UPI002BF7AB6A|nr:phosphatidate cytidylyltransferase [Sphingomonas sp.]HWK34647.1 phosphatidate cytidylyltransferase [Sphingomonas sp.]